MHDDAFMAEHAKDLKVIEDASVQAFALLRVLLAKRAAPARAHSEVVLRLADVAESTGQAVRILLREGLHLPAVALTRVRLEHTILSSYLLHERPEVGLAPYSAFAPITEFRIAQAVSNEARLAVHVAGQLDLAGSRAKALAAQLTINPGFDIADGKFQPKWTSLDLNSMAVRRDTMATASDWLLANIPLAPLYLAIYKSSSAVVHGDGSMLAVPFWGTLKSQDAQIEISATTYWRLALPAYLATCDVLQCYETLRWCGVDCDAEYLNLVQSLVTDGA